MNKLFDDVKKWYLEYHDWPIPAKDKLRKITDGYVKGPVKIEECKSAGDYLGFDTLDHCWREVEIELDDEEGYFISWGRNMGQYIDGGRFSHIIPIPEIGEK